MSKQMMLLSKTEAQPTITICGWLYADATSGALTGWLVNSWSERTVEASQNLTPVLHWFSMEEEKFSRVVLNLDRGAIEVFGEDSKIEPRRVTSVREALTKWEQEYWSDLAPRHA
jgi:hypothetical protein